MTTTVHTELQKIYASDIPTAEKTTLEYNLLDVAPYYPKHLITFSYDGTAGIAVGVKHDDWAWLRFKYRNKQWSVLNNRTNGLSKQTIAKLARILTKVMSKEIPE